jgi:hypothetical protein
MLQKSAKVELSGLMLFLMFFIGFIITCPASLYGGESAPSPDSPVEMRPDSEIKTPDVPGSSTEPPPAPTPGQEQPADNPETKPSSDTKPSSETKPSGEIKPGGETKPNGEIKQGASIKVASSGHEISLANVPIWLVAVLAFVAIGLCTAAFIIGQKAVSKTTAIFGNISVVFVAVLAITLFGIIMYQWGYSSGIKAVRVLIEQQTSTVPEPGPTTAMGTGSSGAPISSWSGSTSEGEVESGSGFSSSSFVERESGSGFVGGTTVERESGSGFSSSSFVESSASATERLTAWERSIIDRIISLIKLYIIFRIIVFMINVFYPYFQHITNFLKDFQLRRRSP